MSYFCIRHCTDSSVLAKQCPCSLCWMSRWKFKSEISLLLPSLRILSAWRKPSGPTDQNKRAVGFAVLVKNWRQVLISKCPHKCWYKMNCVDSQKRSIFYLKCIILIFFPHLDDFFWAFSCKWQNETSAKQLDRNKDTFRPQSPLFTQKSLPHLCFYKRFGELSESQIFWWYLNKLKFSSSLLPHTPQRTSSAAALLGEKGQG